jgi:hypothetical protein
VEHRQFVAESRERTRIQLRPLEGVRLGLRALGFATTPAEREQAEAVLLEHCSGPASLFLMAMMGASMRCRSAPTGG